MAVAGRHAVEASYISPVLRSPEALFGAGDPAGPSDLPAHAARGEGQSDRYLAVVRSLSRGDKQGDVFVCFGLGVWCCLQVFGC